MIVKGGGSNNAGGAGPPSYVEDWYYPSQVGVMDPSAQTVTTTATRLYYCPIYVFQTHTFESAYIYNSGAGDTGETVKVGLYTHRDTVGPYSLVVDWGTYTVAGAAAAAIGPTAAADAVCTKGWYWLAIHANSAIAFYGLSSLIGTGMVFKLQPEFGVPALNSATLDCKNGYPYVDTTWAALASTAVAPTTCTSVVPKVWLKA